MKREIFAILLGPAVLATIIFAPAWCILVVIAIASLLAAHELIAMAASAKVPVCRLPVLVLVLIVPVAGWWFGSPAMLAALIAGAVIIPTFQLSHPQRPSGALNGTAVGLLTVVYLGTTSACLGWIRLWPNDSLGIQLVIFFLISIWLGDSGAYYVGRNFGRHHMSPKISPKKTWEGLIASIITTLLAAAAMKLLFLDLPWSHTMALAAILAVTGPLGDLVESQYKRDTGVKDSSHLIPGHGGLLDRTDSLFFAAPPVLGYLVHFGLIR